MSDVAHRSRVSAADYLVWERQQPTKHEYYDGEVFAMAGGSPRHNALCVNISSALRSAPQHRDCTTFSSDQRVGLAKRKYVYPDVSVVCGDLEIEDGAGDVVINPAVVVEVLSFSTEAHDRGGKWEGYRGLASLADYLLVSQTQPQIEHYQRGDHDIWSYRAVGSGERITLASGAILEVDELFEDVMDLPGDSAPVAPGHSNT